MKNTELFRDVRFYYIRDVWNRPLVTICLIRDLSDKFHRGISICAEQDNPCKKIGKELSLNRAMIAVRSERNSNPIERAWDTLYDRMGVKTIDHIISMEYKSGFDIALTNYEAKLMFKIEHGTKIFIHKNMSCLTYKFDTILRKSSFRVRIITKDTYVKCSQVVNIKNNWYLEWRGHRDYCYIRLDELGVTEDGSYAAL